MRARYRERSKATDLQQAPYSWVVGGRYCVQARKAELKPRDLHKVPGGIEELKSFVCIVGRPPPPVCGSVIVEVRDAEKPNFVQKSDVLTRALPEEGSQGPEVVEVEDFANIKVD
jgi:hypothetical protein